MNWWWWRIDLLKLQQEVHDSQWARQTHSSGHCDVPATPHCNPDTQSVYEFSMKMAPKLCLHTFLSTQRKQLMISSWIHSQNWSLQYRFVLRANIWVVAKEDDKDSWNITGIAGEGVFFCLADEAQIRRVSTTIGEACSLLISIWCWKVVTGLARSRKHLTLIIGSILHLSNASPSALPSPGVMRHT